MSLASREGRKTMMMMLLLCIRWWILTSIYDRSSPLRRRFRAEKLRNRPALDLIFISSPLSKVFWKVCSGRFLLRSIALALVGSGGHSTACFHCSSSESDSPSCWSKQKTMKEISLCRDVFKCLFTTIIHDSSFQKSFAVIATPHYYGIIMLPAVKYAIQAIRYLSPKWN